MKRGVREYEYDGQKGSDAPVHRLSGDEEQEGDDPGSENGRGGDHTGCHRQEKRQSGIFVPQYGLPGKSSEKQRSGALPEGEDPF